MICSISEYIKEKQGQEALRTIQRQCPNMKDLDKEFQGYPGIESDEGQEGQQLRLLPVDQQRNKNWRTHIPSVKWERAF